MTPLTKKQAWAKIAEAFAKANGGKRKRAAHGVTSSGLCWAVRAVNGWPGPVTDLYFDMVDDISAVAKDSQERREPGWWWPKYDDGDFTSASDHERAMLAQLLSESAED